MGLAGSGAALDRGRAATGCAARIIHGEPAADIGEVLGLGLIAPESAEPPRPLYLRPADAKPQTHGAVMRQ